MKKRVNNIYISDTDVGKGIFAKNLIKKNEVVLKFSGSTISSGQINDKQGKYREGRSVQIDANKYIGTERPGVFTNHSCNPNAGVKNDIILIAIRNIKRDEEIRFDYSTTMDEDQWTLKCKCGQKNCRKIIKDFKYLPKNTQKKYLKLDIVQKFIARKYRR